MTETKFVEAAEILDPITKKNTLLNMIDKGVTLTDDTLNKQSQEVIDLTQWKESIIQEIGKIISSSFSSLDISAPDIDYDRLTETFTTQAEKLQARNIAPPLEIDYDRLTAIFAAQIEKLPIVEQQSRQAPDEETKRIDEIVIERLKRISFPNPYPKDFALIISLLVGLTSGIAIFGAIANFYLVPHAIETNRLLDNQQIKFLNSSEGQFYLRLIKANSGYIDSGKCQAEAQAQKLKLTRTIGTTKTEITNVCLVKMP